MRIFILSLVMGTVSSMMAQNFCYTTEMQNRWFAAHPEQKAKFDQLQQQAAKQDLEMAANGYQIARPQTNNPQARTASTTSLASNYTVPVVFHILHTGGGENISDAQVMDAMSILTRDFNLQNTDTNQVVAAFKHLIGNPQIEFRLATKDPNGNCTNGIIRHYDANTEWSENFSDYIYTWPATKYLNVYVVKSMGGGAAGYTYLPGSGVPASADAVVILSTYVGSIGTGSAFTSRALTHEVGHWFNLQHTWGNTNQPGVACGDDGVSDTPITKGYSSCNLNTSPICNAGVVENMQNYMDYAYCQRMYTLGQTARMLTSINSAINSRNNVSSTTNLSITGVTSPGSGCLTGVQIGTLPSATVCAGKTISLASYTDIAAPSSLAWSTSGNGTLTSASASLTSVSYATPGNKVVTCVATNANGSTTQTVTIVVRDPAPQIGTTYFEGFESGSPANWNMITPDNPSETWVIGGDGASEGGLSAYVTAESFSANATAILESPSYDFKDNPGSVFSFKYAYAKQSNSNKDKFKVQASKDCGSSWADIYAPNNTSLASGSGDVDNNTFYPGTDQWKLYDGLVNLPLFGSFLNQQNVMFRFSFQEDVGGTGHGNRFYLDEVNFSSPTGINEFTKQISLNVYPNPTSSAFNLSFSLGNAAKIKYQVISLTGAVIISEPEKTMTEGPHEFKINENGKLSPGIYFLNLDMNGVKMSKKIVIAG